MMQSLNFVV